MQKFATFLLVAACSVQAMRMDLEQMMSLEINVTATPLEEFMAATSLGSSKEFKEVKGVLIGNLIEGLMETGKVADIIPVPGGADGLIVKLTNRVYGQVATRSSVPVMWVVDPELKVTVDTSDGITLHLEGLHTDAPAQAYTIYQEFTTQAGISDAATQYPTFCGNTTAAKCTSYLKAEAKAASEWFKGHYNKKMKKIDSSKKVGKVLSSLVSNLAWIIKKSISWDNWGSIVYSMVSAVPKTVTSIQFKDGTVVATAEPWHDSPNSAFANDHHLLAKAQILGADSILNAPAMLAKTLAAQAKSGWGFGMLFGHGDPEVASQLGSYPKANPAYLVNLFSHCAAGDEEEDPPCTGTKMPGRIHWTDTVPAEYA